MQEDQNLSEGEKALMESLSGLLPEAAGLSEQSLWYQAGLRAGRHRADVWRGAAVAMIVVASGIVAWRPKPVAVYVDRVQPSGSIDGGAIETATPHVRSLTSIEYVPLRDAVEQHGMEALPKAAGSGVLSQPTQSAWSPLLTDSAPNLWDSLSTKG